jgi:hypothetical protein
MFVVLADAAAGVPSGAQWTGFEVVIAFVLAQAAGVAAIIGVFLRQKRSATIHPQPLQIEWAKEFTSQTEFQKHLERNAREHENLFSKIGGVERGMMSKLDDKFSDMQGKAEEGREKLHVRINEIFGELREMKGEIKRRH